MSLAIWQAVSGILAGLVMLWAVVELRLDLRQRRARRDADRIRAGLK